MKKFLTFIVFFCLFAFANGQNKVALLIGNSTYTGKFSQLHTPSNDVDAMNHIFQMLGYKTIVAKDVSTNQEMSKYLKSFKDLANGAEVALFYYSGHGGTINNQYYLVPSGDINSKTTLSDVCFSFKSVEKTMEDTRSRTKVYFIDACRNALDNQSKGRVHDPSNTEVVQTWGNLVGSIKCYAASENKEVVVPGTATYSIFTEAVFNHIGESSTFDVVWKKISNDVINKDNTQQPYIKESSQDGRLISNFRFNPSGIKLYPIWNKDGFAKVVFNINPSNAKIKISRKPQKKYERPDVKEYSSGQSIPLLFGITYDYEIECPGYDIYRNSITPSYASSTESFVSLDKRDKASLKINSNVKKASIH